MESAPAIRIFIVDDQSMIRAGFRSILSRESQLAVVGDTGDPRSAVDDIAEKKPDVVLLDISMPGLSGIDALPLIRKAHPKVKVVMLTHHEGESFVEQALRAGADGYLSKDSDPSELVLAVNAVHQGRMYLSPRVAGTVLQRHRAGPMDGGSTPLLKGKLEGLTPREREVFQLLALGKSNKEIARTLEITLGTTKKHRENLQRKLDCHSVAEMALLAIREGLMSP